MANTALTKNSTLTFFTIVLGICSFLLLFPSHSGLTVFSKGEFAYVESLGLLFAFLFLFSLLLSPIYNFMSHKCVGNTVVRKLIYVLGLGGSLVFMLIAVSAVWIRYEVKEQCQTAKNQYDGKCVVALEQLATDEKNTLRSRNNAVWALGQLGDNRAYKTLKKMYTGDILSREPIDTTLSQYELRKALRLTSGERNPFSLFWRYGFD